MKNENKKKKECGPYVIHEFMWGCNVSMVLAAVGAIVGNSLYLGLVVVVRVVVVCVVVSALRCVVPKKTQKIVKRFIL